MLVILDNGEVYELQEQISEIVRDYSSTYGRSPFRIPNAAQKMLNSEEIMEIVSLIVNRSRNGLRDYVDSVFHCAVLKSGKLVPWGNEYFGPRVMMADVETALAELVQKDESLAASSAEESSNEAAALLEEALDKLQTQQPDEDKRRTCLSTLVKVVENIVSHPTEEKFRRINMANPAFSKKVADLPGGPEAMLAVGFVREELDGVGFWVWKEDHPVGMELLQNTLLGVIKSRLEVKQ